MFRIHSCIFAACFFFGSVSGWAEDPRRVTFRQQIENEQWEQARGFAYSRSDWAQDLIVDRFRGLEERDDHEETKDARFRLLDFYWSNRPPYWKQRPDPMRVEYLQLASELGVAEADTAFTDQTSQLFDRYDRSAAYSLDRKVKKQVINDLIELLKDRPTDIAVLMTLQSVSENTGGLLTDSNRKALKGICQSPVAKIVLAEIFVATWPVSEEETFSSVDAALPHLPNDELRAELLLKALERRDIEIEVRLDTLQRRYPLTLVTRRHFEAALKAIGDDNVVKAERILANSQGTLEITDSDMVRMKELIVSRVRRRDQIPHHDQRRNWVAAQRLLDELLAENREGESESSIVDSMIALSARIGDAKSLDRVTNHRMRLFEQEAPSFVSLHFAKHLMTQGHWTKARQQWELWPASSGWCGSWGVFPSETRQARIAVCRIHEGESVKAVKQLANAIGNPGISSRVILPFVLFRLYERADQLDDFQEILASWEADERANKLVRRSREGSDDQRIDLLGLQPRQWTVRGMFQVLAFAQTGDWPTLVKVCQSSGRLAFEGLEEFQYRIDDPFESSITIEAARQLSKSGAKCIPAIRSAYFKYLDSTPMSRLDRRKLAESKVSHDWVYLSLLDNPSPEAKELLAEFRSAASRLHINGVTDTYGREFRKVNTELAWPAIQPGGLPQSLPVAWNEVPED